MQQPEQQQTGPARVTHTTQEEEKEKERENDNKRVGDGHRRRIDRALTKTAVVAPENPLPSSRRSERQGARSKKRKQQRAR